MSQFLGNVAQPRKRDLVQEGTMNIIGGIKSMGEATRRQDALKRQAEKEEYSRRLQEDQQELRMAQQQESMDRADEQQLRQRALDRYGMEKEFVESGGVLSPEVSGAIGQAVDIGEFGGVAGLLQAAPKTEEFRGEQVFKRREREAKIGKLERESMKKDEDSSFKKLQATQKNIDDIRREVQRLPVSKDLNTVSTALKRIKDAAKRRSAAGDLSLVFNFMKSLDPNSVVRESEFKNAAGARAALEKSEASGVTIPTAITQAIQKLQTGALLTPSQRIDFTNTAAGAAQAALDTYRNVTKPQRVTIKERGLPSGQVFGEYPQSFLDAPQNQRQTGDGQLITNVVSQPQQPITPRPFQQVSDQDVSDRIQFLRQKAGAR